MRCATSTYAVIHANNHVNSHVNSYVNSYAIEFSTAGPLIKELIDLIR